MTTRRPEAAAGLLVVLLVGAGWADDVKPPMPGAKPPPPASHPTRDPAPVAAAIDRLIDRRLADRPVSARDFMASVCKALGIDYTKTVDTPGGRPVKVVEKGAAPIAELFD